MKINERSGSHHQSVSTLSGRGSKCVIEIIWSSDLQDLKFQPQRVGRCFELFISGVHTGFRIKEDSYAVSFGNSLLE